MRRCQEPHCAFPRACAYLGRFDAAGERVVPEGAALLALAYGFWAWYVWIGWVGLLVWPAVLGAAFVAMQAWLARKVRRPGPA